MTSKKERTDIQVRQERAVLAAVHLPTSRFDTQDPLGELRSLAETSGATVVGELVQKRDRPEAGTYMGSGKVEELKRMCEELDAGVIIFDHELSPKQIANIEKIVERKVLDRSELILDIFASRATTRQAKLAVELAQLEYTYPRLRAMWSHLERIVGHGGIAGIGTRGPGEQQLEIDRRLAQTRKNVLRRELNEINARKQREVRDRRSEAFTVGIVGYTNAGKSTLFNTLTAGGAFANDQLFATLITRTREWNLGGGISAMLSDTVGFVRDLPHHLIASFRATLEEATHADVLLIVLDISDSNAELQYDVVQSTLDEIFEEVAAREKRLNHTWVPPRRLLLLNKTDRLADNAQTLIWQQRVPDSMAICARHDRPLGLDDLAARVRSIAVGPIHELLLEIPASDARGVSAIERRAEVVSREWDNGQARYRVRIGSRELERIRASHPLVQINETISGFAKSGQA